MKPGEPPPKDIIPPTNLMKGSKMEQMNIEGALVELDYVSQENKDIQKRRKFLFRVVSQNDVEYIMQAPNLNLRKTWVSALQAVAHNMPLEEEVMVGHAIKASRDSVKHRAKGLHKKISSGITRGTTGSASSVDDSDYVEFSTAEAMVASGGDPRLQALRKRLQAKKELLKQLNRMYTSFLGGNAAAMYDETLILTQMEPPTFDNGSPLGNTAPANAITKRASKKSNHQVVHRKLTVSETGLQASKSFDGAMENGATPNEEDRRASTGEMSVPAVLTSVSPIPMLRNDVVLETELLMDYYLVPGAEWSLVKKGETVQVIGKAQDTGWYRCMALRDSKVRLDTAPFAFLSKSMATTPKDRATKRLSGITPEMVEEDYKRRRESDPILEVENEDFEGLSSTSPPPPLMPRSQPHPASPLHQFHQVSTEDLFPNDMEMEELQGSSGGGKLMDIAECPGETSGRESAGSEHVPADHHTSEGSQHDVSSGPSPDLNEVSSVSQEDPRPLIVGTAPESSNVAMEITIEHAQAVGSSGVSAGEKYAGFRRRPSYQQATLDRLIDPDNFVPGRGTQKYKTTGMLSTRGDSNSDTIKRSTSSVESSSQAAVKLRRSLEAGKAPRAASTAVYSDSLYQSALGRLPSNSSMTPVPNLDKLIDREVNTKPYHSPLIGCIPPSALKHFANQEKKKVSSLGTSPAHSHSDVSASESSGGVQSRPVSDSLEATPTPVEEDKTISNRKYSNARIIELRDRSDSKRSSNFTMSVSLDDDSDGEADRRQALMFKTYDTIDPDQDAILRKGHFRAKSLPPPVHVQVNASAESADAEKEEVEEIVESSLDRKPSHLRKNQGGSISPDPSMHMIPPCQSVGSSPLHRLPNKAPASPGGGGGQPISALFDSSSKSGLLKKFFARKGKGGSKLTTPEHAAAPDRTSPGPPRGMLKQVLLGNTDYEEDYSRARVSSMSGKPVLQKGMGIVIGEESSSESEDDDEEGEANLEPPAQLDPESSFYIPPEGLDPSQSSPSIISSTPSSPSLAVADKEQLLLGSFDQTKLELEMRARRARTPEPNFGRLKRSASDHDTLKLKAKDAEDLLKPSSTSSLKRNMHMSTSFFPKKSKQKPRAMTSPGETTAGQQPIKKNRLSKKRKKSFLGSNDIETGGESPLIGGATDQDTAIKLSGIFRQPPRGEKRFVYLDPSLGKYGFRLQSYGRIRDQGKVLQTFVQSVVPGSPSFMAGLYPGDAIVEVNGKDVKYAPVEDVVAAIQEGGKEGERVALLVEFVDGVTRLECMRKSDEFKNDIKTRQKRLEELRGSEQAFHLNGSTFSSPNHMSLASQLPLWATHLPTFKAAQHKFPYNRQVNEVVAIHNGAINTLECDVLVMPISSCHKPKDSNDKNILLQLLRTGGPELLDNLSLAKQCKIGENISTLGHALPAKYIYHCVFGDLEESLQSCCQHAMESAFADNLKTVVFWLDGFASLSVSPHIVIDAVRNWMQEDTKRIVFDKVVFSSKANSSLVEKLMQNSFPLFPSAARDSGGSFTDGDRSETESMQNGTGSIQDGSVSSGTELLPHRTEPVQAEKSLQEESLPHASNGVQPDPPVKEPTGDGPDQITCSKKDSAELSTEDLLESLDAIQDENMKTFDELVVKLAEMEPEPSPHFLGVNVSPAMYSRSLPSHYQGNSFTNPEAGTTTLSNRPYHSRSQSGDHILNPGRTESDV